MDYHGAHSNIVATHQIDFLCNVFGDIYVQRGGRTVVRSDAFGPLVQLGSTGPHGGFKPPSGLVPRFPPRELSAAGLYSSLTLSPFPLFPFRPPLPPSSLLLFLFPLCAFPLLFGPFVCFCVPPSPFLSPRCATILEEVGGHSTRRMGLVPLDPGDRHAI